uniref:FAD_binding_2 domain-containing protein n=1 Tax=Panagrellus redivivus TaxID=6233 RepID=A0A7E4VII2_PANRE
MQKRLSVSAVATLVATFLAVVTTMADAQAVNPGNFKPLKTKAPRAHEPLIVVGGGLAGLTATLEALRAGAEVILIDKSKDVGGNSAKASSGINGAPTATQARLHIEDSTDRFYTDTMNAGDRENDAGLVDVLTQESNAAIEFLTEAGVDLSDINLCGGHSVPRTHWLPQPKDGRATPVGFTIIRTLKAQIAKFAEENPGKFRQIVETEVVGIVTWNDFVTGVRVKNATDKYCEFPLLHHSPTNIFLVGFGTPSSYYFSNFGTKQTKKNNKMESYGTRM